MRKLFQVLKTYRLPSRKLIARSALLLGSLSSIWLAAGAVEFVPLLLSLPGESGVRVHAAVTIGCLLLAAWGYWDE